MDVGAATAEAAKTPGISVPQCQQEIGGSVYVCVIVGSSEARLVADSPKEHVVIVPAKQRGIGTILSQARNSDSAPLQWVIATAVFEVLLEPVTDHQAEVSVYGDVPTVEEPM